MKIAIVSNLAGIGLQTDAELLQDFLTKHGHSVTLVQFNAPCEEAGFDLAIFLEVPVSHLTSLAPRRWIFPNPEWNKPEYIPIIQRYFDKVFAKTHHAYEVLKDKFYHVHYTGFLVRDKRDLSVPREPKFLHIGGNSGFRNTQAILAAWREFRYFNGPDAPNAPLTLISNSTTIDHTPTPGVTFHKRVSDEELTRLQNSHLFHLFPSAYEGFGQALHESLSVGAIVLSTDAPPMNERKHPFMVPSIRRTTKYLGTLHEVSGADIRAQVPHMLGQYNISIAKMSLEARLTFERINKEFEDLFLPYLATRPPQVKSERTVAVLGNHQVSFSTERELDWAFEDLGWKVLRFQENSATTDDVLCDTITSNASLFIYIHTHGWDTPGTFPVKELISKIKEAGVKTAGFHLDRYVGLNESDQRESRVGQHPFWSCDYVFTADGGNQKFFRKKGINHFWLPPGSSRFWSSLGTKRSDLEVDVGFVGARGPYHPEYPEREQLIRFLEETYGKRFRLFQGLREQDLNDAYNSIRVTVGDSCFANSPGGTDRYWSDRVPESMNRGAFLIHPAVKGLSIPGLVTYEPGDFTDLQNKIDWFLAHEEERTAIRQVTHKWANENETYHNRISTMLKIIGVNDAL